MKPGTLLKATIPMNLWPKASRSDSDRILLKKDSIVTFLKQGIEDGDRCLYVVSEDTVGYINEIFWEDLKAI